MKSVEYRYSQKKIVGDSNKDMARLTGASLRSVEERRRGTRPVKGEGERLVKILDYLKEKHPRIFKKVKDFSFSIEPRE